MAQKKDNRHPVDGNYSPTDENGGFLDKPRDSITDDRFPGRKLSIRNVGEALKEGFDNYKDFVKGEGDFERKKK